MKYTEAVSYIEGLPMWANKKNSITDIKEFISNMDILQENINIIHVAGTNGKGSICVYITEILTKLGYKVGTFISPHLIKINERILINKRQISDDEFADSCNNIMQLSDNMSGLGYCHPTYFEFLYYMAMDVFKRLKCDYVILETGLGGRLDATNSIITPKLCVLTSISMDHMQYLGDTIDKIAFEKAGIIKPGITVVLDVMHTSSDDVVRAVANRLGSKLVESDFLKNNDGRYDNLVAPYMRQNAYLAETAVKQLGIELADSTFIMEAIKKVHWAGRMDEVQPDIFIDGAHNEDGIKAWSEAVTEICEKRNKKPIILISVVSDKDIESMAIAIAHGIKPEKIYICSIATKRALSEDIIFNEMKTHLNCEIIYGTDAINTFKQAKSELKDQQILFCTGSLYLVGELLSFIRGKK